MQQEKQYDKKKKPQIRQTYRVQHFVFALFFEKVAIG